MKYYINNNPIELDISQSNKLGKGKEGSVYRFEDKAIKIYRMRTIRKFPYYINYEKTILMSGLKLHRFNKPLDAVFNKHNQFCGHTMELVLDSGNILDMNTETLLTELNLLDKDSKTLTKTFFRIRDLHLDNIKIDDKINILDCNSYEQVDKTIRKNDPYTLKEDLLHNYNCLSKVIVERLSKETHQLLNNNNITIYDIYHILWSELVFSKYNYLGHLYEQEILGKFESPKDYIKYKVKKHMNI